METMTSWESLLRAPTFTLLPAERGGGGGRERRYREGERGGDVGRKRGGDVGRERGGGCREEERGGCREGEGERGRIHNTPNERGLRYLHHY